MRPRHVIIVIFVPSLLLACGGSEKDQKRGADMASQTPGSFNLEKVQKMIESAASGK